MNVSIAIAQVLGIVLTVTGLSVAVNRKNTSTALDKVVQDRGFLWVWGFLILTTGSVLIVMNSAWASGLQWFITILGWLTLIKGAFILLLPGPAIALYRKCNTDIVLLFGGIVAFVVGLVLLYFGFVQKGL